MLFVIGVINVIKFIISVVDTSTTTITIATTTTNVPASTASINLFTNGITLQGYPVNENRMIQLNTVLITASVTAVIIILPVSILFLHMRYRYRKAIEEANQSLNTERVPMESQDPLYDEMNEGRSSFATNANMANPNVGLGTNNETRSDSYQTLNDAIVSMHVYQSVGESPIDSSQDGEIDTQRSNYEPLSRRNIVETENNYD